VIFDAVIYDIEIQKAILGKGEDPKPGVKYCDGWSDHKGMGIGVLCAMDTRNAIMRVFLEDNLDDFARLIEGRTIVGYNSKTFDDKIITANGINTSANQVDLFDLVTKAAGCLMGVYVSRPVRNTEDLILWADRARVPLVSDPHVTIVFSRKEIVWIPDNALLVIHPAAIKAFGPLGDMALVVFLTSPQLEARWNLARDLGATWDYVGYKPHISLAEKWLRTALPPIDFPLVLGPEKVAALIIPEDRPDTVSVTGSHSYSTT
jgi:hypothetical protein